MYPALTALLSPTPSIAKEYSMWRGPNRATAITAIFVASAPCGGTSVEKLHRITTMVHIGAMNILSGTLSPV